MVYEDRIIKNRTQPEKVLAERIKRLEKQLANLQGRDESELMAALGEAQNELRRNPAIRLVELAHGEIIHDSARERGADVRTS